MTDKLLLIILLTFSFLFFLCSIIDLWLSSKYASGRNNKDLVNFKLTQICVSIKPSQWTHLHWLAIDSMLKFDVESSSRFSWFWKVNPHGNYDINSTWKLRRGLDFQNRQNIDQLSTWVFLCRINVELTLLLYSLFPLYRFLTFSALGTYSIAAYIKYVVTRSGGFYKFFKKYYVAQKIINLNIL